MSFLKSFFACKLYKMKRKIKHFWRSFLEAFWKAEGAKSVKGSSKSSILGVVKKEASWASWGSSLLIKWGPRRMSFCLILNDFWMHFWSPMSSLTILRWDCDEAAARLRRGCGTWPVPLEWRPYFIKRGILQQYSTIKIAWIFLRDLTRPGPEARRIYSIEHP